MKSVYGKHDLYRWYNKDGVLLYVGISFSAIARAAQHKRNSQWFGDASYMTIEKCKNRQSALDKEAETIKREKPIWNVVGNKDYKSHIDAIEKMNKISTKQCLMVSIKYKKNSVELYEKEINELEKEINELEDDIHNLTFKIKKLVRKRNALRVERNTMSSKLLVMMTKFYYKTMGSLRGRKIGDVIYL